MHEIEHAGLRFIGIEVEEFDTVPVLCNRDYPDVLRDGACYVRSRKKPETAEVPRHEDMRDLLDLATEKLLQRHIQVTHQAGGQIVPDTGNRAPDAKAASHAAFDKEIDL